MAEVPATEARDTATVSSESTVKLNSQKFWERISKLRTSWQTHRQQHQSKMFAGFHNTDALLIFCGSSDNELYKKNNIFHLWLFGFELLNTIVVITNSKIVICAREKTCRTLDQLQENRLDDFELELVPKDKKDGYAGNYDALEEAITSSHSGRKLGFIQEAQKGRFVEQFKARLEGNDRYTMVDYNKALSDILMIKDREEQKTIKTAGEFTTQCLKHLQRRIEQVIEDEGSVTHQTLSEELTAVIQDPSIVKSPLKEDQLELCFEPIIQSGGTYSLSYSATCNSERLSYEYGTVVCMLGFRYREYCANIARTFFIDASKQQRKNYELLIHVYKKALMTLRANVPLNQVWNEAIKVIKKKDPSMEEHFLKNLGWGMGLEFGDKNYLINRRNDRVAQAGMIFNLQVGFQGLVDQSKKDRGLGEGGGKYSMILADTVVITDDKPEFYTKFKRTLIDYQVEDDEKDKEESEPPASSSNRKKRRSSGGEPPAKRRKTSGSPKNGFQLDDSLVAADPNRRVTRNSNKATAAKQAEQMKMRRAREKNQAQLREKARRNLERLARETGGQIDTGENELTWEDPKAYARVSELPTLQPNRVNVDVGQECVICPIMDHMVPFHVSTIKNVNVSTAGEYAFLRMNFLAPAAITSRGNQPKQPEVALLHPESMFVKELSFRSKRPENLHAVSKQVKDIQKKLKQRAKQAKEKPLAKQDKLKRISDRNLMPFLRDLQIKPNMSGRKKDKGVIECHKNGFRLRDGKGHEIPILFSNISNAFFQPAKGTPAVVLHFHLKNPLMVGKKVTEDFQVSKDVIDRSQEIGRSGYDYDGPREEMEEKRRRVAINKSFKAFVDKSQKIAEQNGHEVTFDMPEMSLGFSGVPNKSSVKIYPTSSCLVALDDSPPFVLPTDDVEIAHFERVQFSLRNFDLVFVFKDFTKDVKTITSIPRENLDTLQDFLNWKHILYSTGKMNLDWKRIMQQVRSDLRGFIDHGGWNFLQNPEDTQASDDDDDRDRPASGSEYEPDEGDDDYGSEASSSDYSSGDGDDDDDEEDYGSDDDGSGDDYAEDDEEGLSWDELEKQAEEQDRRTRMKERNRDIQDSSSRPAKRRRTRR